jgi:hypothetical protein
MTDADNAAPPETEPVGLPIDHRVDLELGRRIGRSLLLAARRVGVRHDDVTFADLCERIISAAVTNPPGKRLDEVAYNAVCEIRAVLVLRDATPDSCRGR